MELAKFECKCRRCGEIKQNPVTSAENGLICLLAAIWNDPSILAAGLRTQRPQILSTHTCADGGMGVCDLIGYAKVDE